MNIELLYDKDDNVGYKTFLNIERECLEDKEMYNYFDEFLKLLDNDKSYIRVRGFKLICALSKWDKSNKIEKNVDKILSELDDELPT